MDHRFDREVARSGHGRGSLAAAVLLVALLLAIPVWAQGDGFSESFDHPELEGWERSPETVVRDGVLRISPGNFGLRFGDWNDLTMTVRMKRTGPEVVVGYRFRDESRYALHLVGDQAVLIRTQDRTETELGNAPFQAPGTDWFTLQISVLGNRHEIALNDQPLIGAEDPDPLPPGGLMFHSLGDTTVELDSLTLEVPQSSPPPDADRPLQPPPPGADVAATGMDQPTPTPAGGARALFESLLVTQANPPDVETFAINLGLAALLSFLLGRIYVHWGTALSNRRKFAANFMIITLTTTFIILVVRSSVALSLGLVGALSIVRFRTAIKEPEELAYLFLAIGLGIGLGDNQRLITILALAAAVVVLGLLKLLRQAQADENLQLIVASHNPGRVELDDLVRTLRAHTTRLKLVRFDENETEMEASFIVEFAHLDDLGAARAALRVLSPSIAVTFLDNKGIW